VLEGVARRVQTGLRSYLAVAYSAEVARRGGARLCRSLFSQEALATVRA